MLGRNCFAPSIVLVLTIILAGCEQQNFFTTVPDSGKQDLGDAMGQIVPPVTPPTLPDTPVVINDPGTSSSSGGATDPGTSSSSGGATDPGTSSSSGGATDPGSSSSSSGGGTGSGSSSGAVADPGNTVCDPFGGGQAQTVEHGLTGTLYYLASKPTFTGVANYQSAGIRVDTTVVMSQLNVPTRSFRAGFATQDGTLLKNSLGETLIEWFSLSFESEIGVADLAPGKYQFALLSDDGAILKIKDGADYRTIVDNDGEHSAKLACSSTPVTFSGGDRFPLKIDYYQGPRDHIALMLLWRPWPAVDKGETLKPSPCGLSSIDQFFNSSTVPSTPGSYWKTMVGDPSDPAKYPGQGWKIVAPTNFFMPGGTINPCVKSTQ